MYALVEDNNITQFINQPKSIVVGDVRYPAKIFQLWSQSEKQAIGLYEVVVDNTNYKDPHYYINTNEQYTFADGQVTKSWGTATAKQLEDTNATDEDGNELDPVEVIKGLKSQKKDIVKQQASGLLSPTDWYVIKATEVEDYSVPSNITTFRSDVRAKSNEMETMIDNCTTVDELKALYEYTEQEDGTTTRPLPEFPEDI
nr:N-acetylmuramidase/lysin [uncultured Mediterranean phage uvMED]